MGILEKPSILKKLSDINTQLGEKANKTYYGEVNILDYESYKTGADWGTAFNQAIQDMHTKGCNVLRVPIGIYNCSTTINLIRGMVIKGSGIWDDYNSSVIRLANGSNCTLIKSPYAQNPIVDNQTHYVSLENIRIDGNRLNQTTESVLVDFQGLYVGSWIKNVMIYGSKGVGLKTGNGQDLYISNLWVVSCDVTNGYACEFGAGGADGITVMENIYVENTTNGSNPVEFLNRTDETVRGKGMLINGYANLSIYGLHMEGHKVGVHIKGDNRSIIIDRFSSAHMGNSNETIENCQILFDTVPYYLNLRGVHNYLPATNYNTVGTSTGGTINSAVPGGRLGVISGAINSLSVLGANDTLKRSIIPENTEIPYKLKVTRLPDVTYDWSGLEIDSGSSYKISLKGNSSSGKLTITNPSSVEKDFINFSIPNLSDSRADYIQLNGNLLLRDRTESGYCNGGELFRIGTLIYRARGGNNHEVINGSITSTSSPANVITPDYVGQECVDTANKIAYKACGTTSADWKQITN